MTLTREAVQAWLDRYVDAWHSYEPDAIRDLFAEGATYRYHPWDEPLVGRDAILNDWAEPGGDASRRDAPGTFEARYEPWAIDGDRAVTVGISHYWTDTTHATLAATYHNCFLIRLDGEGRCTDFTEYYVKEQ